MFCCQAEVTFLAGENGLGQNDPNELVARKLIGWETVLASERSHLIG